MSMRVRFAGRDPSMLAFGTDSSSSIVEPRRSARITGGAGVRTIGGSGGPFCPHEIVETTINAEIAEKTTAVESARHRDLCDLCVVRRFLTICSGTGLRS